MTTPLLFTPLRLRGIELRNRIMVAPMCQYRSVDGGPSDWHLVHLGKFAMGGAAIVFGDETAVEARGRKTHDCAGLYNEGHVKAYRRITDFIRSLGAAPAIQLGHSGRKASVHGAMENWRPLVASDAPEGREPWTGIAPSAIPDQPGAHMPRALDHEEIADVVRTWGEAARRAVDAGYDICEIHGAHGYLIQQFLSPISNRREDGYGGDRAGRMRFALEVAEVVRTAWPADRPVFFRVSAVDGEGGAWDMDDTVALSVELKARGIDAVDCSSGGIRGKSAFPPVPRVPGFQVGYASRVKREAGIRTVAVGLITDPHHAESVLEEGHADIIALARGLMQDSEWPVRAAAALGVDDPYGLFPPDYAYRLRERDRVQALYPPERPVAIPHACGWEVDYSWPNSVGKHPSKP